MESSPHLHQTTAHHRSKSSVFRSVVSSSNRNTSPSKSGALSALPNGHYTINNSVDTTSSSVYDSDFGQHVLGERVQNENAPPSPRKMKWSGLDRSQSPSKENSRPKIKKEKSTTRLAAFFSKQKDQGTPDNGAKTNLKSIPPGIPQDDLTQAEVFSHEKSPTKSRTKDFVTTGRDMTITDAVIPAVPVTNYGSVNTYHSAVETNQIPSTTSSRELAPSSTTASSTQSRGRPERRRAFDGARPQLASSSFTQSTSNVKAAVAMFNEKSAGVSTTNRLSGKELETAFETVLILRNVPENTRTNMRSLDDRIKADFVKYDQIDKIEVPKPEPVEQKKPSFWKKSTSDLNTPGHIKGLSRSEDPTSDLTDTQDSPSKRHRSRSRPPISGRGDTSPSKRNRSTSKSRSLFSLRTLSSTSLHTTFAEEGQGVREPPASLSSPDEFVRYLRAEPEPQKVEIGKMHKLRLLVRNEIVEWVSEFITRGGMPLLFALLRRILKIEWREEHEDLLMHEVLLTLKGVCTTRSGLDELAAVASSIFPELLKMLFDEDRKGPSEFKTRGVVINLLFTYLASASTSELGHRAKSILGYLAGPQKDEEETPHGFIQQMHKPRPYKAWCKEVTNVTKEVFWIFLHHLNVVQLPIETNDMEQDYCRRHFPHERPPIPAAAWVGGVEWDATNYIATHLDLLNAIIASLHSQSERNSLRVDLEASGFEKLMGGSLRLCKEKFYSVVHDGLRTWVSAAVEDGWDTSYVRKGPIQREYDSPSKSPKKNASLLPRLDLPSLNLGEAGIMGQDVEWL